MAEKNKAHPGTHPGAGGESSGSSQYDDILIARADQQQHTHYLEFLRAEVQREQLQARSKAGGVSSESSQHQGDDGWTEEEKKTLLEAIGGQYRSGSLNVSWHLISGVVGKGAKECEKKFKRTGHYNDDPIWTEGKEKQLKDLVRAQFREKKILTVGEIDWRAISRTLVVWYPHCQNKYEQLMRSGLLLEKEIEISKEVS